MKKEAIYILEGVLTLLQNTSVVSAGKISLVSVHQVDTIHTI
jgi:hypothetical protein